MMVGKKTKLANGKLAFPLLFSPIIDLHKAAFDNRGVPVTVSSEGTVVFHEPPAAGPMSIYYNTTAEVMLERFLPFYDLAMIIARGMEQIPMMTGSLYRWTLEKYGAHDLGITFWGAN